MSSDFIYKTIDEIADVKSGKRLPKGHSLQTEPTKFPYIRLVDVAEGRVQKSNLQYLASETQKYISKYIVNSNDVCLAIVGNTIGLVFYIDEEFDGINLTENAARITNYSPEINSRYLYYYLTSRRGNNEIISRTVGSAQGKLPIYSIREMEIPLPKISHQNEIAKTLSNLDKKITLLRQQNQTLEELAQTLFNRWFVDFEFPCLPSDYRPQGQVNLSEMAKVCTYQRVGGLPAPDGNNWFIYVLLCEDGSFYKGMTNDIYRRFYEHYTGQGAKHTKAHKPKKVIHWEKFDTQDQARKREEELKSGYGRTWIQRQWEKVQGGLPAPECQLRMAGKMMDSELGEIPEGWEIKPLSSIANYLNGLACQKYPVVDNKEKLPVLKIKELGNGINENTDWATSNVDSKYIIESGDIIFSWSGTLMLRIWDGETCVLNQHLFKVTSDLFPDWFIFQWTNFHLKHFIAVAKSKATTMGHIKRSHLDEAMCFVPNSQLFEQFDGAFKTLLESFKNNNREIYSLTQLRDTLLPKLMSGDLKINAN